MRAPLFFLLLLPLQMLAQNLVINPGFEQSRDDIHFPPCRFTEKGRIFNERIIGWSTFLELTPDFISIDLQAEDCGFPAPRSGNRMLGFINYYPASETGWLADYHEFFQGQLSAPLTAGQEYEISFWLNRQEQAPVRHLAAVGQTGATRYALPVASNNIGILFLSQPAYPEENFSQSVRQFGYRPQVNIDTIVGSRAGQWIKVKATFTARGAARYFIIGNFFSDGSTLTRETGEVKTPKGDKKKPIHFAYYCIDEVYVGPVQEDMESAFQEKGTYTFQNLEFATGSHELPAAAFSELDALATYLQDNPGLKIEIGGHTDNIGQAAANQQLSERRARSVYEYLQAKGIPTERLRYTGYGESRPVGGNDRPEGRQRNRRVECVAVGSGQ